MNKQKDPSFKSLSIQTESAILRKCTRKIRNVGNSSMSTTIRCWLSVDLIKMGFFFLLFVSAKKLQNVLCCISSTEAVLVTVKRPLCTDLHLFVCWMLTEILFICERIVLYPVERFHRQKQNVCSVLHHAPGSLSMIKHQAGLRSLQVDTATRDTQKKNAFVHLVRSDKNNMSHTNRLITSRSMLAEQKLNYEASKAV